MKNKKRNVNIENDMPKDIKKSFKNIIASLKNYYKILIIALVVACFSAVLAIIGPGKLKKLTDEISKGLKPDTKKIELITKEITSSLNKDVLNKLNENILSLNLGEESIDNIFTSSEITTEEKIKFNSLLNSLKENNSKEVFEKIPKMPDSIINIIVTDGSVGNVKVTKEDKLTYMKILSKVKYPNHFSKYLVDMPKNIQKLILPSSYVENVKISTEEKVKFLNKISKLDKTSSVKEIYKTIDVLPKEINNLVKPKLNMNKIKNIVITLVTIYLLSFIFNFIQGYLTADAANKYSKGLRKSIIAKINKLPLKYLDNNKKGDILSRVTNDVDTIGVNLSQSLGSLVGATVLFLGCIIMMFINNYIMAITAIVSSLIGFIFMVLILSKSEKYFIKRQKELGKLNAHIEEIYSNHNVVKAYNATSNASQTFDRLNENVFESNKMSQFLSGLMPAIMNFVGNFGYVAVCIVGAILTIKGHITFGTIVAFMIYVRLFTSPLTQIAQDFSSLQQVFAASERVFSFLTVEELSDESNIKKKFTKKKLQGNIEFKHVNFSYDKKKRIIKDFNCKVKKGNKVAIVGPTGAGKTTLINLLMKFYDIDSGDILIDGVSIKNIKRDEIHNLFVMVLQDTWLFNGTIRDNVKFNKKNVSDKKIKEALKVVGIDHFVDALPEGLDYIIKDSSSVSQGQRQLLTIARGMILDAPFLILDEATSNVDTRTEELVQKAMDKLTKGKTSFIIAHRLSTIKNADIILVMKNGSIIETGNHKKLMKDNGFYAELYNSQFKK